jgi:hypothetical protein
MRRLLCRADGVLTTESKFSSTALGGQIGRDTAYSEP